MPHISVIVPVYKVEAYLPRCIESILNQTFVDFELILVNDGSPDNCGEICNHYGVKDARISVIHQKNSRVSAARNAGMDISSGEWIAFIDPDDWIHKDYLKILWSGIEDDTDVVLCNFLSTSRLMVQDADFHLAEFRRASLQEIYRDHYVQTRIWGRLFRRSSIGGLRFISGTEPTEDACFNELLYRDDMHFRITDAKLYYYYMRSDSAVQRGIGRGTLNSIRPLLERMDKIDALEKRRRIILRCYKYIFSARYSEMYEDDYSEVKKECKNLFKRLARFLPELRAKDRMVVSAFLISPILYRAWRIYDDPTLMENEKQRRMMRHMRAKEEISK